MRKKFYLWTNFNRMEFQLWNFNITLKPFLKYTKVLFWSGCFE